MIEQTVVLVKPDGVQRKVVGEVIKRIEKAGLDIKALKFVKITQEILDIWYAHHREKPFYPSLCAMMMETPVVAMVVSGEDAIQKVFDLCGPTDPAMAPAGTIRRDLAESKQRNVVHRSDSVEAAQKEIGLLFNPEEIY